MSINPPMGVIFDMDGVLIDSAEPHFRSWQLLGASLGRPVTRAQFTATFGQQNRDIIPVLFGGRPESEIHALSDRKEQIYRDLVHKDPPIVEGAAELVNTLHEAGVLLAVGSSGPRANIDLTLDALEARDKIGVVVSGDDVTRGKPDPQVFRLACQRLGLEPARCVVIEDAPAGIEAARRAGTRSVAVLMHHPREAFEHADHVVKRLADLQSASLRFLVDR